MRIATRTSPLALWQARYIGSLLDDDVVIVPVVTRGDRDQSTSLELLGGQGIFVKEVQRLLLDGECDIAVHSAKDLPSQETPGLVIGGVPPRGEARDVVVGRKLSEIASGGTVGTSSARRACLIASLRPDISIVPIRGNIETRLSRLATLDAIVMAGAALERLGMHREDITYLEPEVFCPQVGQGTIAVECREDDHLTLAALAGITDATSHRALLCERAFLGRLGGGCTLPLGAYAQTRDDLVHLRAFVGSRDGRSIVHADDTQSDPVALGIQVAETLIDMGAIALLGRDLGD